MANEEDTKATSTTNVRPDGEKKDHKGKKHLKSNEKTLLDPTPSKALTSHPHSTTEASDDDCGEDPIDVTPGEEWIARVETARQAVEILGRRMNKAQLANQNQLVDHYGSKHPKEKAPSNSE
uniref:Uncharacterized protein n=1 Tax=Solanum tuberosum TaxID=4113 RepID=M1CY66_SOLTU